MRFDQSKINAPPQHASQQEVPSDVWSEMKSEDLIPEERLRGDGYCDGL